MSRWKTLRQLLYKSEVEVVVWVAQAVLAVLAAAAAAAAAETDYAIWTPTNDKKSSN